MKKKLKDKKEVNKKKIESDQDIIDKINEFCEKVDTSLDHQLRAYVIRQLSKVEWED